MQSARKRESINEIAAAKHIRYKANIKRMRAFHSSTFFLFYSFDLLLNQCLQRVLVLKMFEGIGFLINPGVTHGFNLVQFVETVKKATKTKKIIFIHSNRGSDKKKHYALTLSENV